MVRDAALRAAPHHEVPFSQANSLARVTQAVEQGRAAGIDAARSQRGELGAEPGTAGRDLMRARMVHVVAAPMRHVIRRPVPARRDRDVAQSTAARPLARDVVPTVRALLEGLGPTPAFVTGPANDVLAWNHACDLLVRPLGMLDDASPNLARYVFLHPDARTVYPDWLAAADEQVSRLRAATGRWGEDAEFAALMDELRTAPEFVERWSLFATTERRRGTRTIVHRDLGRLRLNYEVLLLPDDVDEQRLITWLPADETSATALARFGDAGVPTSPAQLRVIG